MRTQGLSEENTMSDIVSAIPGTSATSDVAVQAETSAKPKLGSKLLKLNPETLELRERIRAEAFRYVRSIDRSRPLSKKDLEAHAGAMLENMGLEKGYLGFAMVMLGNGFWKEQFVSIPFNKRILLLPHCLKHVEACSAHYDEFGLHCEDCGACSIGDFKMKAEKLGYKIMVAEGTPIVLKVIVSGYVDGILGIACLNVLEKAFEKVVQSGVPAYAIPLHSSNCKSTTVDNDWVMEVLETYQEEPVVKTRSYVPLMRAANDMFGDEFPPSCRDRAAKRRTERHKTVCWITRVIPSLAPKQSLTTGWAKAENGFGHSSHWRLMTPCGTTRRPRTETVKPSLFRIRSVESPWRWKPFIKPRSSTTTSRTMMNFDTDIRRCTGGTACPRQSTSAITCSDWGIA